MPTSINIYHFDAKYRVSKSLNSPPSLKCRLDHIAKDLIASVWEGCMAWKGYDDIFCFIKDVQLNFSLNPIKSDNRTIANIWANALHEGILRTISQRGGNVVIFKNRSEYLASFISDILRGRAWEKWYYTEFEHLKLRSVGQAIVRVLLADGDIGRDTLIELTRHGDLDLLLNTLTDADAEAVVSKCLLPPGPGSIPPDTVAGWVNAIRRLIAAKKIMLISAIPRDLARLYLHLLKEHPELGPDINLARFIYDLLKLRQKIMILSDHKFLLKLVESGDLIRVLSRLQQKDGQQVLSMLIRQIGGTETAALLQDLKAKELQGITSRIPTQYGGIFLLVPAILEMGLYNILQHSPYPEPIGMSKAGLLFYLIALQCLGRKDVEQAQRDKGVALFAGFSSAPTGAQISQYSETLTPEMHKAFAGAVQAHQIKAKKRPDMLKLLEQENTFGWFSLYSKDNSYFSNMEWDKTLSAVSSIVLMWFTSKLGAFASSSPEYLCRNFLKCPAEIEVSADCITVSFLTCSLQMVLRMAGFDQATWIVPWLEDRKMEFHFE